MTTPDSKVLTDHENERKRLTREALADVDAGQVVDHQEVQAWADSLSANINTINKLTHRRAT